MATIRETDLMLVCVEAGKALTREYNMELNNALGRIANAMYEGRGEGVVVEMAVDNPVERDVVVRCTLTTIGLVLGLEGGK